MKDFIVFLVSIIFLSLRSLSIMLLLKRFFAFEKHNKIILYENYMFFFNIGLDTEFVLFAR